MRLEDYIYVHADAMDEIAKMFDLVERGKDNTRTRWLMRILQQHYEAFLDVLDENRYGKE